MARYNSINTTGSVAQGSSIASPFSGLLTTITTGSGSVALPNPVLYSGQSQNFYNSTASAVTITTPSGQFIWPGTSASSSLVMPAGSMITVVSDGTNYEVMGFPGGPLSNSTITANGTLTALSTVTFNPSNASVSIQPTGSGTVTINPATAGTMDNVAIGSTTTSSGKFTTGTFSTSLGVTTINPRTEFDLNTGRARFNNYLALGHGPNNNDGLFFNITPSIDGTTYTPGYTGTSGAGAAFLGMPSGGNGGLMLRVKRHGTSSSTYNEASMTLSAYWDDSGNMGIQTNTPAVPLDINTTSSTTGIRLAYGGGQSLIMAAGSGGTGFWQIGNGPLQLGVNSNGSFSSPSGSIITIANNGNVGFNITSPQVALQLKSPAGASGTLSLSGSAANDTGGASYILMGNTDSSGTTGPSMIVAANRTIQLGRGTAFNSASGGTFTADFQSDGSGNVTVNPSASTSPVMTVNGQFNEWPQWNSTYNVAIGKRRSYGWNMNAREYHTQKNQQASTSTVGVFRVATDTANWMSTFIMIDVYSQYYSGGAVEKYYWSLAYGSDTLTQVYSVGGNQSTNFTVTAWGSGTYVGNGAPAAYKYYDFSWQGGYYSYPSFVITVNDSMSLVSSITSSYQIQFL